MIATISTILVAASILIGTSAIITTDQTGM